MTAPPKTLPPAVRIPLVLACLLPACAALLLGGAPAARGAGHRPEPELSVRAVPLGVALHKGLTVTISGLEGGLRFQVQLRSAGHLMAGGTGRADAAGADVVHAVFSDLAAKELRRRSRVTLLAFAPGARSRVTLRRGVASGPAFGGPPRRAAPRIHTMRLAVEVTGLHVVDWHREDEGFPDPDRVWIQGEGTQILGFSTPRPVTYLASAFSGTLPGGEPVSPLALAPLHAVRPLRGLLRRHGSWHHGDGVLCDREGGCPEGVVVPLHQKPDCPVRRLPVSASLATAGGAGRARDRVVLKSEATIPSGLWRNCPPDMEGERAELLGLPTELTIPGAVRRIARLPLGGKATFKAAAERGAASGAETAACPPLKGLGFQQCAVTDVTVEVTRIG